MNYLAHAFLSNNEAPLLLGNFIADHIRGNQFHHLPQEVIKGIELHREIDRFSDSHPLFRQSKRIFYQGFERYSGILVDMYFDHFLALNFSAHSSMPLSEFSARVYRVYQENLNLLPERSHKFLDYVLARNVYLSYGTEEGILKVLSHLSHRIGHGVMLNESASEFRKNRAVLEQNFETFFSEAKARFLFPAS